MSDIGLKKEVKIEKVVAIQLVLFYAIETSCTNRIRAG